MHTTSETNATVTRLVPSVVRGESFLARIAGIATLSWGPALRIASVCLILYWIAIFIGTHLPGSSVPKMGNDKILHFGAFGGLAFLVAWALPTREGRAHMQAIWTLGLIIGYALVDELTQSFIPGRNCSLGDFVADAIGAVMGLTAYFIVKAVLKRTSLGQKLITALSR